MDSKRRFSSFCFERDDTPPIRDGTCDMKSLLTDDSFQAFFGRKALPDGESRAINGMADLRNDYHDRLYQGEPGEL
jgi:hypothetical protein